MSVLRFPGVERPRASIIIVAWKQYEVLLSCLRSLSDVLGRSVDYEVIVVSNDAPHSIKDGLRSRTDGVQVVEAQTNLGFGGACNLGASVARGEYLVLLNDDAFVAPGWLDWLVSTADANPAAGAVGSLVLFPDGRMQEAGSVVWADGSTMPVGRGLPGDSIEWHFTRKVDYVSACSLLVTRRAWNEVGGFDPEYHPAYYEDVDLCLALNERGYQVLLEPRSRVWHHESSSSDGSFKRFLFGRNQRRLRDKWAETLTSREPPNPTSSAALTRAVWRARDVPTRILVVDDRLPDASLGSGYGRMLSSVLELAQSGHALTIYPTLGAPTSVPDVLVSAGVSVVEGDLAGHLSRPWVSFDIVIVSRPHNFERVAAVVRQEQPHAVLLYDCEALFWRRMVRQATLIQEASERIALEAAAVDMQRVEERIIVESDFAVAVSEEEAAILASVRGACPIRSVLPVEAAVTFGRETFHERRGVAYVAGWLAGTGSPNADGLRWFVAEVLPLLRQAIPWVRIQVTGANPPADLLALADANLFFVGHLADLAAFYNRIRVVIAPIRFGAGVKVKTVQAVQHGVPVVSTSCGAEGIATYGLDALAIADTAKEFAAALVTLLTDRTAWDARRAVLADVVERWQNDAGSGSWSHVIAEVLARRNRGEHAVLVQD